MLDASVNIGSRVLETQLDSLLFALHHQVHMQIQLPITLSTVKQL